jgi:hypothetical protein
MLPEFEGPATGNEEFETVQNGTSVRIPGTKIAGSVGNYVRETPMQISVGGAVQGTTFDGSIQDALDKLLYPAVASTLAYSISPSLAEKGTTVTEIQHTGTITANGNIIADRELLRNGVDVQDFVVNNIAYAESVSITFATSEGGRTSTLRFTYTDSDDNEIVVSVSRTLVFAAPAYYGVGAAGLNEAQIKALTKQVKTSKGLTANFSPTNQRFYYAWPASQGSITSVKDPNNFEIIDSFTLSQATFTLADGITTELMNILASNNNTTQVNYPLIFS